MSKEEFIIPRTLLSKEPKNVSEDVDYNTDLYKNLQNWSVPILKSPDHKYVFNKVEDLPPPLIVQYNNEFNLSDEDTSTLKNKIEKSYIEKFVELKKEEFNSNILFDVSNVYSVTDYRPEPLPKVEIPETYNNFVYRYFKLSLLPIQVQGSSTPLTNYSGILYMFNTTTRMPVSESACFKSINNKIIFNKTDTGSVYFKIPRSEKHIVLVCVLLHPDTGKPGTFLSNVCPANQQRLDKHVIPVPFAFSILCPFTMIAENNFNFSWTLITESDTLAKVATPIPPNDPMISLISKAIIKEVPFDSLEPLSTLEQFNKSLPYLVSPCQSLVFSKEPIITISNISFQFNNVPKAFLVYFRVFLCENTTDMTNPVGTTGFLNDNDATFSNVYQSCYMQPGKKVVFPDIVRFFVTKQLAQTSHFVIQFVMLTAEKEPIVYKCAFIELFNSKEPLEYKLQTYPTVQAKKFQGDYISQNKIVSHSNLQCVVDLPPAIYPPIQFVVLSEAQVPMQVNWDSIIKTPPSLLNKQILPTFIKLLQLINPQTMAYIIELLSMFKDDLVTRDLIRSYLYNNFNLASVKHNLLSTFTNSLDQVIQENIDKNIDVCKNIVEIFDIIGSILVVSFSQRTETWIPQTLISCLQKFSTIATKFIKNNYKIKLTDYNLKYGWLVFHFCSLLEAKIMTNIINTHIRNMLSIKNSDAAMMAVFEFLIPLTQTTDFIRYYSTRLPVKPLSQNLMSPFQPTLSLIFLCISEAFGMQNPELISLAVNFIARLTLAIETIPEKDRYIVGFALFPLFDLLTVAYETAFTEEDRHLIVPTVMFLLTYIPRGLMKIFFKTVNATFRSRIIVFITTVTKSCITQLNPEITIFNSQLNELTKRIIMFIATNIREFSECITPVCQLICLLATTPHQVPRNYPRLFRAITKLTEIYPRQRIIATELLSMITMKSHIARCFAASTILFFFKSDYDTRHTTTISSAEVLDVLTSLMLNQPPESIPLYQLMLTRVSEMSTIFNDQVFVQKLHEKIDSAQKIADVISNMRKTAHDPSASCEYVMQIANQYMTYPSMRLKWLSEIVNINKTNNNYSAAFVAQLHKCALIATVIEHERKMKPEENEKVDEEKLKVKLPVEYNLLVTQPITMSKATLGRDVQFSDRDFEFIQSVLVETKIDFGTVSDAFKFLAGDFTIDLFKSALDEAIEYGMKVHANYTLRCLKSIQLRIFASSKHFNEVSQTCTQISDLLKNISITETLMYDIPYIFSVFNGHIFCNDFGCDIPLENRVYPSEQAIDHLEFRHAWKKFRTKVPFSRLQDLTNSDADEISMTQYTVEHALPRFTPSSKISESQTVKISLQKHAEFETERICNLLNRTAEEFEKCFPTRNVDSVFGKTKQNIEGDLKRVVDLIKAAIGPDASLFCLLKLAIEKGNEKNKEITVELAKKVLISLQKLIKVYHRAIEYLESASHFTQYAELGKYRNLFLQYFGLPDIDTKSYEGKRDPVTEKCEFEY
ncbi:hypothetical protein TVAG_391010 [Trichomonas vaginalis G3]|uniref:DOCKER Lobe A domain-containing protein n=1 Tax=Trichomonas vaginalis (strain ATCC PRA-98 / G3) TaxID=412133 RepID=A2DFL4_TRIV3|nr:dedicator of cytokinesis DOCK family [Trichomonas vaginalis G3]EAY20717.1 hypothetical protein TVAG_391010 [Trichomonas vaginalis G3]KAI5528726.1 dedicator of cytokinesis DOCK family [Trichomonas vaginalis G3]|eukprot:XP_001581703.1 hypothetical protein [Trichomonas vaginalis G3]